MPAAMSTRLAARPAFLAAAVLLALPLAACQANRGVTGSIPAHAAQATEEVALDLPAGPRGLTRQGHAAAGDFLAAYGQEGAGPLHVQAPGGAHEGAGYHAVGDIRKIARATGVPESAIAYDTYYTKSESALVTLSYRRVAAAAGCGRWPSNVAGDWRNLPYENFGCATDNNLAAMVEDPRDLAGPRPEGPRDARRRDTVFENYRSGEATAGQSDTDQASTASDVGN